MRHKIQIVSGIGMFMCGFSFSLGHFSRRPRRATFLASKFQRQIAVGNSHLFIEEKGKRGCQKVGEREG